MPTIPWSIAFLMNISKRDRVVITCKGAVTQLRIIESIPILPSIRLMVNLPQWLPQEGPPAKHCRAFSRSAASKAQQNHLFAAYLDWLFVRVGIASVDRERTAIHPPIPVDKPAKVLRISAF